MSRMRWIADVLCLDGQTPKSVNSAKRLLQCNKCGRVALKELTNFNVDGVIGAYCSCTPCRHCGGLFHIPSGIGNMHIYEPERRNPPKDSGGQS